MSDLAYDWEANDGFDYDEIDFDQLDLDELSEEELEIFYELLGL